MNERIKELAVLASDWCIENAIGTPVAWEWEEKFAELIVKECVHIAYNMMAVQKRDGIQPSVVCDAIIEHFGVEE